MKLFLYILGAALIALSAYLLLWPVPINPQSWDAPADEGYVGAFAPNEALAGLTEIDLPNGHYGPEDIVEMEGLIYMSTQTGWILSFDPATGAMVEFAKTGGKPLGLEVYEGRLYVANAYKGLLEITADGEINSLTDTVNGTPILYADDLDVTDEGLIYFSDASTKFGAKSAGSTMDGSLLEIMEHGRTGRLLTYDLTTQKTKSVAEGISFSNGVAIAPDGNSVWVNETGEYRVLEISPEGDRRVVIDSLPGFPDNINRGPDGTYLLGLVSKRAKPLDDLSSKPFLRKIIWRLPEFLKPAAENYGFVVQLDSGGGVVRTWQDSKGAYPLTTGGIVDEGRLYVSSLGSETLGYRPYP
ncbi:SMP-30/gluconolactonase/LRE family protein [Litorimonas haliclonae]|uniref:SMP-30/gluconolactonase/LRE family protein n=1 Tax=Litorimonas haliclonae TaxID=2081977 RepID=UPI0039EE6803